MHIICCCICIYVFVSVLMHIKCCCICIYVFEKEKGKIILFYEIKSEKVFSLFSNKFDIWCFSIFFENFKFFLVFQWLKKIRKPFFLSKSKVQKIKNVDINYFYQNLKFYKYWIAESQKKKQFWSFIYYYYSLLLFIT